MLAAAIVFVTSGSLAWSGYVLRRLARIEQQLAPLD